MGTDRRNRPHSRRRGDPRTRRRRPDLSVPLARRVLLADRPEAPGAVLAFDPKEGLDRLRARDDRGRARLGGPRRRATARRSRDSRAGSPRARDGTIAALGAALPNTGGTDARALELRDGAPARAPSQGRGGAGAAARGVRRVGARLTPRSRRASAPASPSAQLQVELEAEFFRGGGDRTGYGSIVGAGPNSGVLHFDPRRTRRARGRRRADRRGRRDRAATPPT